MSALETFDTPSAEDVLERDETPLESIPVHVVDTVRTDEMSTRLGMCATIYLVAGARAVKVLQRNPRRKRTLMWPANPFDTENTAVCIAATESDCNDFRGAIISSPGANSIIRFEFTFRDELWARPVVLTDTTGNNIVANPSVDDMHLYVITEDWAR